MFDDLFEKLKSKIRHLRGQGEVDEDDEEEDEDVTGKHEVDSGELDGASDDATQEISEGEEADEDEDEDDEEEDKDEDNEQAKRSKLIKGFLVVAIAYLALDTLILTSDKEQKKPQKSQKQAKKTPPPSQDQKSSGEKPKSAETPSQTPPSPPASEEVGQEEKSPGEKPGQKLGQQEQEIEQGPSAEPTSPETPPVEEPTPPEDEGKDQEGDQDIAQVKSEGEPKEAPEEDQGGEMVQDNPSPTPERESQVGATEQKSEEETEVGATEQKSEKETEVGTAEQESEDETDVGESEKRRTEEGKELEGAIENLVDEVEKEKQENLEYVDPPSYEIVGRGLVYNCKGGHWACVDREAYFACRDNKDWSLQNDEKPECYPVAVYGSKRDCKVVQLYNINTNAPTNFCSGETEPEVPGGVTPSN